MKQFHKIFMATLMLLAFGFSTMAQNRFFSKINESEINQTGLQRMIKPQKYAVNSVDLNALKTFLWSLPSEKNVINSRNICPILSLPMPDGSVATFRVWESSIQEPALEAKFPEIKTFAGQGIDDPYATIRFDLTPFGFHAQILSVNGNIYIDPYARGNNINHISYYTKDNIRESNFVCEVAENLGSKNNNATAAGPCRGTQLYSYRLALACTGEYAVAVGGTTATLLHAAIVTSVNRIDGVYESELAVRLILVANNNLVEFTSASTDPFTGNNNANTLINESQTQITNRIGSANFDIGHTFSTGGGGLAGLGVVCNTSQKARGITGSPSPVGDDYDIDYVAHEMGHQFGGDHTFNSTTSNCGGGNRNAGTAYEVGSGTTIMGYAGICTTDDIQPHSDPFFHSVSFDEISNYIEAGGSSCKVMIATGNTLPQITSMDNNSVSIPLNTPFTLTASATDANGDALTYCWEEWDLGTGGAWNNGATSTTAPLFKSRIPKTTGSRTFPDMSRILANYLPATPTATMGGQKGETLPTVARTIKFRLTVRDNRAAGGGIVTGGNGCQTGYTGTYQVTTIAATGPFIVSVPNGGESWAGGTPQTITWNVAGTNAAPINTTSVKISLSTDGGLTYPTVLLASTVNDGTESVTMPGLATTTTTARVKVEALNNVFFDISNANFTITQATSGFTFDNPAASTVTCGTATSATSTLGTVPQGGFSTPINLTASGNPAGTTVSFGTNPVTPGSSSVVTLNNTNSLISGTYNITVTGTAGAVTQTRILSFTITPTAPPAISAQPTDVTICAGSNANFTVSSSTPGITYQWQISTNGGATYTDISGAVSSTYSITGVGSNLNNNKYRVIISTQCGFNTSTAATLVVNAPTAITSQPASVTICDGNNVNFTSAATGNNVTYQWQLSTNGGGAWTNIAGATNPNYSLTAVTTALNTNQYQVIATVTSGGCPGSVNSSVATLTVNATPVVSAISSATNVCTGTPVTLTANGAASYSWTPGGLTGTSVTVSPTVNPSNPGNALTTVYTVVGTNPTGCNNTTTVSVTANPLPIVTLTASPNITSLFPGLHTTLTANVVPASASTTYQWYINGVLIPGQNNQSINVDIDGLGLYTATATIGNFCSANSTNSINITDSLNTDLFIYPNPNNGIFQVRYNDKLNGESYPLQIIIYDSKGSRVYSKSYSVAPTFGRMDVDLRNVASGVYFVDLIDASGMRLQTGKAVIKP